eukprot:752305-Hanusia_phi.AAC.3
MNSLPSAIPCRLSDCLHRLRKRRRLLQKELSQPGEAGEDRSSSQPTRASGRIAEGRQGNWWEPGNKVEVLCEGDWWQAIVLNTRTGMGPRDVEMYVGYVGGSEEDNEWIPVRSHRARPPTDHWDDDDDDDSFELEDEEDDGEEEEEEEEGQPVRAVTNGNEGEQGARVVCPVEAEEGKVSGLQEEQRAAAKEGEHNYLRINLSNQIHQAPPPHRPDAYVVDNARADAELSNILKISREAVQTMDTSKTKEDKTGEERKEEGDKGGRPEGYTNGNFSPYSSVPSLLSSSEYKMPGAPQ